MTRKIVALIVTTLLFVGLFPATAAFASAAGSARITSPTTVFPAKDQSLALSVTNNELQIAGTSLGKSINYVSVIYPVSEAGVVIDDDGAVSGPANWTVTKQKVGSLHSFVFRQGSGSAIAPGASANFTLPAHFNRPTEHDRSGAFTVQVSSDGGRNNKTVAAPAGGTLTMNVKILELKQLAATEPAGVTDQTATGGQAIEYGYCVTNHALNAVSVTAALGSSAGDSIDGPHTVSVPGDQGGCTPVSFDVTLADALTANRTSAFTANASSSRATAASKSANLAVQQIPQITLTNLRPARVRSGLGADQTFQVTAAKSGTPALPGLTGALSFASTNTDLAGNPSFSNGAGSQTLTFERVQVDGSDGTYPPSVSLSTVDDNGKPYSQTLSVNNIIIDNLAPDLSDITVGLPDPRQTASKAGDSITVTGCISQAAEDINLSSLRVVLDPDVGDDIPVDASASAASDGCDYRFSGSGDGDWVQGATSFVAKAEVADTAGNVGGALSDLVTIDLQLPELVNPGHVQSSNTIRVQFTDNLLVDIDGGCDPDAWQIDGVPASVEEVNYPGQTGGCDFDEAAPAGSAGVRILTTRLAMDRDDTPTVTYTGDSALNEDPAEDGALNTAAMRTIDTLSDIIPPAPTIDTVTRNNGSETAYSETDAQGENKTYFTRFPGTGDVDTEDLELTFAGVRANYFVQVIDQAHNVLNSTKVLGDPASGVDTPLTRSREFTGTIRVPIGATDGSYVRGLRVVSTTGNLGHITWFNVALDTVVPAIGSAVKTDDTTVRVEFSEPLATGTDWGNDWFAWESITAEPEGDRKWYRGEGSGTTVTSSIRDLHFAFENLGPFGGAEYWLTTPAPDGVRYEDRAGNLMADTMSGE